MYTHCPNCNTHFEITQEYLDIAHGKVRCGQCDHIFNALENLYNDKSSEPTDKDSKIIQDIPEKNNASANNQVESTNFTIPNIDIKEKMERIVASLSAATQELKNARETTTFHKPVVEKKAQEKIPSQQPEEATQINDPLLDDELLQIEDSLLADELLKIENSLEIDETHQAIKELEIDELHHTEGALIDETHHTEEALIDETHHAEEALIDETHHAEEALEIDKIPHTQEALESENIPTIEDELEIIEFNDDKLIQTNSAQLTDFSAHQVDQNDIDILNSLINNKSEQSISDSELDDELDDINKTLSDKNLSLDDDYTSLDEEFDQLDNGDDLLAELEQLENNFLNNTQNPNKHDSDNDQLLTDSYPLTESSSQDTDTSLENIYTSRADVEAKAEDTELNSANEAAELSPVQDEIAPSFLTQNNSSTSTPSAIFGWLAATLIFLAVLASQYLHFNSATFSQNPEVRPLLESLCSLTGCSLPLIKTPKKIVTVTHDVRTHPTINNALEIQLTFKNKAAYTQSYPILEITFSNSVGEVIAHRKFLPDEYLQTNRNYTTGLKNNQSQEVNLNIVDPEPASLLSFQFNYL